MRSGPGEARTILLLHIISVRPSKQPLMVRTFLKVHMDLCSYFLFLQEQIKDIIIIMLWFRRDRQSGNFGIDVCFKEEAVASCDDEVFIVGAVVVTLNPAVDIRFHHAVFRLKGWQYISPN